MKTIWKFWFPISDRFELVMPVGAKVLTAFVQFENEPNSRERRACLWAEVDNETSETRARRFAVVGTGGPMPHAKLQWVATFPDPPFIWHLYEVL